MSMSKTRFASTRAACRNRWAKGRSLPRASLLALAACSRHLKSLLTLRQFRQHAEIFERRRVAFDFGAGSNLLEQAAHDFSRTCLRQRFGKTDIVGPGHRPDFPGDMLTQFVADGMVRFDTALERDERHERLTFQFVGPTHHRGFGHFPIAHQRALDFRRADAMPGHVQHIVDAAHDPVVTVLVLAAAAAGEITLLHFAPVNFLVTLRITPDAAQHARPRFPYDELSAGVARDRLALVIHDFRHDAEKRKRGGGRLRSYFPPPRRGHDAPRLGLPPRVDDRTSFAADDFVIPDPRFGIDRFAHRAQ